MRNLISLGAPQQGVHQLPRCDKMSGVFCAMTQWLINSVAYSKLGQKFVPLTYWHDTDESRYRKRSTFLAVINNENKINRNYINNLAKLERIVLVKYVSDGALVPKETSWFGFYSKYGREYPMEETEVYIKDKLGLRNLTASGKLVRLVSPGDHLHLYRDWFKKNIIKYLKEVWNRFDTWQASQ